jgi:uroporphyrin-III C-methyltransferase
MSFVHPEFRPGTVWLVGAGPGDPGLLTLLAARALAEADIVLHDALVNPEILERAGPKARIVPVGRRKGLSIADHTQTVALMVRHARAGARVVRLKGGDPFVFGRGAEEAAALAEADIPFRIVPGISAGIGGLAYGGIAVTQRGVNEAVTFVTGHGATGALPEGADWARLAQPGQSLVVYMGLGVLDEIAGALLAHGRDHRTPVAIVAAATTADQRVLVTTLGECVLAARRARIAAPAIIAVGEIADPTRINTWFDPASLEAPTPQRVAPRASVS